MENCILCGDAIEELKKMADESIQMVMTSPPYFGLRDYKVEKQIGLEKTPLLYLEKLWAVFDEIKRVIKKDGVIFINLGDTYGGSCAGHGDTGLLQNLKRQRTAEEFLYGTPKPQRKIQPKCLLMIPEKFSLGMVEQGWILRNRICWFKRNAMPSSVKDRFTCTWEYVYFFSKSRRYYFDLDSIRQPLKTVTLERYDRNYGSPDNKYNNQDPKLVGGAKIDLRPKEYKFNYRVRDAEKKKDQCPQFKANEEEISKNKKQKFITHQQAQETQEKTGWIGGSGRIRSFFDNYGGKTNPLGKNPSDHWDITTRGYKGAHFAVYPEELCLMPIKAGSRPGDIVLDPFAGSCTTAVMAKKLKRKYIMIDLNPEYCKMGQKRLDNTIEPML